MLVDKHLLAKVDTRSKLGCEPPGQILGSSTFANPRSLKTTSKCPTRPLSMFVP